MIKKNLYLFGLILTVSLGLIACESSDNSDDTKTEQSSNEKDKSGPEYTSAYTCPMHCEGSGSDAPGQCPVCEMDYVANESATPKTNETDTSADVESEEESES